MPQQHATHPAPHIKTALYGGLIVILWLVGVALIRPHIVARADYPPAFDEAIHALPIFQTRHALQAGDIATFWQHSYHQDEIALYPFLHSWLMLPAVTASPHNITWTRLASLSFVLLNALAAWQIAKQLAIDSQQPKWVAIGAAILTLVSLPIWVFSSLPYLEGAGLFLTLLTLLAYLKAEMPSSNWFLAASCAALATFFVKYSFGVFVIAGLAAIEALNIIEQRHINWRRWVKLGLPCAAGVLLWFLLPNKWANFITFSQSQPETFAFWSSDNLLYYWRSLLVHHLGTPLQTTLLIVTLLSTWRFKKARVPLIYVLVGVLILTILVPQKDIRFGYTVLPALYPVMAIAVGQIIRWIMAQAQTLRMVAWTVLILFIVNDARLITKQLSYYPTALETVLQTTPDNRAANQFIVSHSLANGDTPFLINGWHLLSTAGVVWEHYSLLPERPLEYDLNLAYQGFAPEPSGENLNQFLDQLAQNGIDMLVSIDGSPAGSVIGWRVIEPLWQANKIELVADSPTYTLVGWPHTYQWRVFAADFDSRDAWRLEHEAARRSFNIQLHVYRLLTTSDALHQLEGTLP